MQSQKTFLSSSALQNPNIPTSNQHLNPVNNCARKGITGHPCPETQHDVQPLPQPPGLRQPHGPHLAQSHPRHPNPTSPQPPGQVQGPHNPARPPHSPLKQNGKREYGTVQKTSKEMSTSANHPPPPEPQTSPHTTKYSQTLRLTRMPQLDSRLPSCPSTWGQGEYKQQLPT